MMHPITIHLGVTDSKGHEYSAVATAPDAIHIWDHERGEEVTTVATWDAAAWTLTLLQSL